MTTEELSEFYDEHKDEFLHFERVEDKITNRPDLHAFLRLDKLLPNADPVGRGADDIVSGADHDVIYIGIDVEELLAVATDDQLIELYRCGIFYSEDNDALISFV